MEKFSFVIPAELVKSDDGEWKVSGLASTAAKDQQGEIIVPDGIDATPIAEGKGFLNWDHDNDPTSTIGSLEKYRKSDKGLFVEGRLFKNHEKAKAVYGIMSSLKDNEKGKIGMSVEGTVIERDPKNPKVIKRCKVRNVALTFSPVNTDTYADLVKSLSGAEIEFAAEKRTYGPEEVIEIVAKALGVSGAYASSTPGELSGGDALAQEDLAKEPSNQEPLDKPEKPKRKKKLKNMDKEMFKSATKEILDRLQILYPNCTRSEIWEHVKDRLNRRFLDE